MLYDIGYDVVSTLEFVGLKVHGHPTGDLPRRPTIDNVLPYTKYVTDVQDANSLFYPSLCTEIRVAVEPEKEQGYEHCL